MAINFQTALGIHEQALMVRERRAEVLANNLANVDTPNFKSRDVDFKSVLQNAVGVSGGQLSLAATRGNHIGAGQGLGQGMRDMQLMYRQPLQPSIDGNTVDEQMEMADFAKNALDYQASLTFLKGKFSGLKQAIRGE